MSATVNACPAPMTSTIRCQRERVGPHISHGLGVLNTFRLLLFDHRKTQADYEAIHLEESAAIAGGNYRVESATDSDIRFSIKAPCVRCWRRLMPMGVLRVGKILQFENHAAGFDLRCCLELSLAGLELPVGDSPGPAQFRVGLELVLNLLAPDVPDRYIEFAGQRKPLEWSGVIEGSQVRLADEWQDVAVEIETRGASQIWISPIETVSESEEGFERVYQGSQILGVWNVTLNPAESWRAETLLRITKASR